MSSTTQEEIAPASDAGEAARRSARRTASLGLLALGLVMSMLGPALPGIRAEFGVGLAEAGVLALLSSLGYTLSVALGSSMGDWVEHRRVLFVGAALYACGIGGFATAPEWGVMLVAAAVMGAGSGLVDGPANALVNDYSGRHRGRDLNLAHGFFGVGAVMGPLGAGLLLNAGVAWRWLYLPGAVLSLAVLASVWRVPPSPVRHAAHTVDASRDVLRSTTVWLLALILCLYVGVEMMIATWAFSHLQTAFGATAGVAGVATALFWGGITVGRFALGLVGDRVGPHQQIVGNVVAALVAVGFLVAAPSLLLAIVALVLTGLALANIFPAVLAVGGAAYPKAAGAVAGTLIAAGGLGGAVFPWLTGVVGERIGLTAGLAGGVGILLVMLLAEAGVLVRQRRDAARAG